MDRRIGRYRIAEKLGTGGFGSVYECYDPEGRRVAVKILSGVKDEASVHRWLDRARIAADLKHRNIVDIYDVGEDDGTPFVAMEFLEGSTLEHFIASGSDHAPMSLPRKLELISDVASALNFAHQRGVVHRDVKPDNIMLLKDGSVRLIDFGVAVSPAVRHSGSEPYMVGTPAYMAPEQFLQPSSVAAQADIWSLGVVFYELLTGVHPFRTDNPEEILRRITADQPPPLASLLPHCPPALESTVQHMLSKSPANRTASLESLLTDVGMIIDELSPPGLKYQNDKPILWEIRLDGSLNALDSSHIDGILNELRDILRDPTLVIKRIDEGSIIIRLEGSEEGYRVLSELYTTGRVTSVFGLDIQAILKEESSGSPDRGRRGLKVIFSYSHRDGKLRTELDRHLSALKRTGEIHTWHDHMLRAGVEFETEIAKNFDDADLILLLVSANFLASDYCYGKEMTRALERHEAGEARVVPIILSPVDWQTTPLGKLLALPKDGKPITTWPRKDAGFLDVAVSIRSLVNDLASARSRSR